MSQVHLPVSEFGTKCHEDLLGLSLSSFQVVLHVFSEVLRHNPKVDILSRVLSFEEISE